MINSLFIISKDTNHQQNMRNRNQNKEHEIKSLTVILKF